MNEKIKIILSTQEEINIELYPDIAPLSVNNFLNLVDNNYYNGVVFHRIIEGFMIQTGGYLIENNKLVEAPKTLPIKGEFKSNGIENPLKHQLGVLSMARTSDKNSATSQFFLCCAECPWLDGEYAAFGKTIDEQSNNVIIRISKLPQGPIGSGFDNFPDVPVFINKVVKIDA